MDTLILATLHIAIWLNIYFGSVWHAAIVASNVSKPVKRIMDGYMLLSVLLFLVSVVVIAGNAFHFLKRW